MALNIENPETEQLIQALASVTGESLTGAVTQAVRERLERIRTQRELPLAEQLLEIGRRSAPHLNGPLAHQEHGDLLYGEDGLPR